MTPLISALHAMVQAKKPTSLEVPTHVLEQVKFDLEMDSPVIDGVPIVESPEDIWKAVL